ncbi:MULTISPECIES: hypothetical protein [Roseobacteraceae]|jgi:starvation-inducible outer membrane lipoprotein|uniref:Lipoprotein n=1 Tax=Pseudosulfitobacter pseudonitzschiae TaxID=1402135 RepID=A0A221JXU5_9RHOB|nr:MULTISPECIES: hypothetical protein [Roseobacteraceae]ASM71559.1 hypothetical protein SULPSESMR1_00728 [Pseudosulfitobacter pseudonitzschiae]
MKIHLLAGAIALALGACSSAPTPLPDVATLTAPTDRNITSSVRHTDPLAGFFPRSPTGPRDWRTVNQEQAEGN